MKRLLLILLFLIHSNCLLAQWEQIGSDIEGTVVGIGFGYDVAISQDGNTIAIATNGTTSSEALGYVRVYTYDGSIWIQKGSDLMAATDEASWVPSVSISSDGQIVAVGVNSSTETSGVVKVYEFDVSEWVQLGENLIGEEGSSMGREVNLSSDGLRVICGGLNSVKVYDFNGSGWTLLGEPIIGPLDSPLFGTQVAINASGSRIITAAPGSAPFVGFARVYQFNETLGWDLIGNILEEDAFGDRFANDVAINSDGNFIVLSAPGIDDSGVVKSFALTDDTWIETETVTSVTGEANAVFGREIAINPSATVMAISEFGGTSEPGYGNIYLYSRAAITDSWGEFEQKISGISKFGFLGQSLGLDDSGATLIVSGNGGTDNKGIVKVYRNNGLLGIDSFTPQDINLYPNPNNGNFMISMGSELPIEISIYSTDGRSIPFYSQELSGKIDVNIAASPGLYLVRIKTKNGVSTQKVIVK